MQGALRASAAASGLHRLVALAIGSSCAVCPLTRQGCWPAELQAPGTISLATATSASRAEAVTRLAQPMAVTGRFPTGHLRHAGIWEDDLPDHHPAPSPQGYRGRCEPGGDCWRGGCSAGLCHSCHSGRAGGCTAGVMAGRPFLLLGMPYKCSYISTSSDVTHLFCRLPL